MNPTAPTALNDAASMMDMMLFADNDDELLIKQNSSSLTRLQMPGVLRRRCYRRLNKNDKAILNTCEWSSNSSKAALKLEDKVSVVDERAVFLQGVVTYVGPVHFAMEPYDPMQDVPRFLEKVRQSIKETCGRDTAEGIP